MDKDNPCKMTKGYNL